MDITQAWISYLLLIFIIWFLEVATTPNRVYLGAFHGVYLAGFFIILMFASITHNGEDEKFHLNLLYYIASITVILGFAYFLYQLKP